MPTRSKQKPVELYKILEGGKSRLYESKRAFETNWKRHAKEPYRFNELIGYKLVKMVWVKINSSPPNMATPVRLRPESFPKTIPLIPATSLFQRRVLK